MCTQRNLKARGVEIKMTNIQDFETEVDMFNVDVVDHIGNCELEGHTQVVSYSTYHSSLTQVCFNCHRVRSNIPLSDIQSAGSGGQHDE